MDAPRAIGVTTHGPFVRHRGGIGGRDLTAAEVWGSLHGAPPLEHLLCWPHDVFAFANRVLEASEAYRFVVSPPTDVGFDMDEPSCHLARRWLEWLDGDRREAPTAIEQWWKLSLDARSEGSTTDFSGHLPKRDRERRKPAAQRVSGMQMV